MVREITIMIKDIFRPVYYKALCIAMRTICWFRSDYKGVIYVDPRTIKKTINPTDSLLIRNDMWHFGKVVRGDWDKNGVPVEEYGLIYPILKQVGVENRDLDSVQEFHINLKKIEIGETPDNCNSEEQYRKKWKQIEALYRTIKENGYKSQVELKSLNPFNEVRVQVGRNGELLFEEGIHRLIISKLLKLKKIPVIVTRRHLHWVSRTRQ